MTTPETAGMTRLPMASSAAAEERNSPLALGGRKSAWDHETIENWVSRSSTESWGLE